MDDIYCNLRKCKGQYYKDGRCVPIDIGFFHQWGSNADENGNYSVGIVELPNGKIVTILPEHITFLTDNGKGAKNINMREILGYNLKNFFDNIDPYSKDVDITYANDRFEVWNVSDDLYNVMCDMTEEEFVHLAGDESWWRSSSGCVLANRTVGDFTIHNHSMIGWRNKPWQDDFADNKNPKEYENLTDYLCNHIGVSTESNICSCAVDLARYNHMTMAELFKNFEG